MKVFLSHKDLSYFLFPDAKRIKSFGYITSQDLVLYELKQSEKIHEIEKEISPLFPNHIIVTTILSHAVDTTLDSKLDYLTFISNFRNIRRAKDVDTKVEKLQDEEFIHFVKMSLALKRWYREAFSSHEKIYNLYEAMLMSSKEFISLYLEINQYMSHPEIFSSVLTFLLRLKSREQQKDLLSDFYRKLTKIASVQNVNVESKLVEMLKLPNSIPQENRFLGFYLSLR